MAALLTERAGYPTKRAMQLVRTAIEEEGFYPGFLKVLIIHWSTYATNEKTGKNIHNIGAFVASKIKSGEEAPAYVQKLLTLSDEELLHTYQHEWNAEEAAEHAPDEALKELNRPSTYVPKCYEHLIEH